MSSPLQHSPSIVSKAAPLTGSAWNSSGVLAPALSSARLLPLASVGTYFQPIMANSYVYQHCSKSSSVRATSQSPVSSSAVSCPGIWQWGHGAGSGSRHPPLETFTVTVTNQSTAVVSSPMPACAGTIVPVDPSLSASLVQAPPTSCIPNQGHGSYYNQGAKGVLLPAELGGQQPYECVPRAASGARAPQPEIIIVLKETEQIPTSPNTYCSESVQANAETRFQGIRPSWETGTSLERQAVRQARFVSQLPDSTVFCSSTSIQVREESQVLKQSPPAGLGGTSKSAPVQSPTHPSAEAPGREPPEKENWDEVRSEAPTAQDVSKIFTGKQDPPLPVSEPPELLSSTKYPIPQEPGSEDALWGECHLSLQNPGTLNKGTGFSPGWADIATLVEDIQLPPVLHSLDDIGQSYQATATEAQDAGVTDVTDGNEAQENSAVTKNFSPQVKKNKRKALEPIAGAPEAKIQLKAAESLSGREETIFSAGVSDRGPKDMADKSKSKSRIVSSRKINKNKGRGQEKTKENTSKKALERKQPRPKARTEEATRIPNTKRKRNQPVLGQEAFKMPRTCLGRHMLESVQVFHPLGKKLAKKAGSFSSRPLGSSVTKDPGRPGPQGPCAVKRPEGSRDNAQKPHSTAATEAPPVSLCELPPPGQVKLIPLLFPSPENPQAKPVSRRPQPPASEWSSAAHRTQPAATRTAQPSQTAAGSTSRLGPIQPAQPVSNNNSQPRPTFSSRPGPPQAPEQKPAPQAVSAGSSFRRAPVTAVAPKQRSSPPPPYHPYLIKDFSRQPRPWREPNVPEPVMSSPISEEQRPVREAMKRAAQRERELVAKNTSLGKLQFFSQREKDRQVAQYYGYVR